MSEETISGVAFNPQPVQNLNSPDGQQTMESSEVGSFEPQHSPNEVCACRLRALEHERQLTADLRTSIDILEGQVERLTRRLEQCERACIPVHDDHRASEGGFLGLLSAYLYLWFWGTERVTGSQNENVPSSAVPRVAPNPVHRLSGPEVKVESDIEGTSDEEDNHPDQAPSTILNRGRPLRAESGIGSQSTESPTSCFPSSLTSGTPASFSTPENHSQSVSGTSNIPFDAPSGSSIPGVSFGNSVRVAIHPHPDRPVVTPIRSGCVDNREHGGYGWDVLIATSRARRYRCRKCETNITERQKKKKKEWIWEMA